MVLLKQNTKHKKNKSSKINFIFKKLILLLLIKKKIFSISKNNLILVFLNIPDYLQKLCNYNLKKQTKKCYWYFI